MIQVYISLLISYASIRIYFPTQKPNIPVYNDRRAGLGPLCVVRSEHCNHIVTFESVAQGIRNTEHDMKVPEHHSLDSTAYI